MQKVEQVDRLRLTKYALILLDLRFSGPRNEDAWLGLIVSALNEGIGFSPSPLPPPPSPHHADGDGGKAYRGT